MKMEFRFKAICNIRIDAPTEVITNGFEAVAIVPTGPVSIVLEYCDGTEQVVDDIEFLLEGREYHILYRVGEDVFFTKQTYYMKLNGKVGTMISPYAEEMRFKLDAG